MNVPQLRFDGFDGEWKPIRFGDVIEKLIGGGTPSRDREDFYSGEIPWVTVKDLKTRKYIDEAKESITELGLKNSSSKIVNSGDLIIPTRMAVGRILIASKNVAINQDLKGCKIKGGFENEFIYYLYMSKASSIEKMGSGSTVSGINIKQLMQINMSVPLIEEQQKVAIFLGMIDRRIDKQKEKVEKLEQYKEGMMQNIFSQELRFKDENGGEFPEWNSLHFRDVVEKLIGGGTPSRQVEEYYGGSIPWVTVKDLKTNKYVSDAMEYITDLGLENSSSKIVNPGDLIIPTRMAVGRVLIATEKVAINQDLKGCKLKSNYDIEFMYYLYFSMSASIERLGSGSTVTGINIEQLMKINIQVPTLVEQKKVAGFLGKLDKKIEKEKEKLMMLEAQKKGFMQGMFV